MSAALATKPLELMSESLQASVSRICSGHFEFNKCLTVIGIVCVNVDNSPSDVMIKFNDCITKADLYRMAKDGGGERNSELAEAANKIVLSSQLLTALKGLEHVVGNNSNNNNSNVNKSNGQPVEETPADVPVVHIPSLVPPNSRKRKLQNPHRLADGLAEGNGDAGEADCGDNEGEAPVVEDQQLLDTKEDIQTLAGAGDTLSPLASTGPLQMNLEAEAEAEAEELAAIDEIDAAAAAAAASAAVVSSSSVPPPEVVLAGSSQQPTAVVAVSAQPPIEVIQLDDDDEEEAEAGEVQQDDEEDDDEDYEESLDHDVKGPALATIRLTSSTSGGGGGRGGGGGGVSRQPQAASEFDLRSLNQQLKGALGTKVFKCGYCGKAFNRKFCLERHERLHTGVKPYACQICGQRYIRLEDKKRHMRSTHPHDFMNYPDEDEVAE